MYGYDLRGRINTRCRQTLIPPRRPQCNSQVLSSLSCSRAQPSQVPCLQTVIHCVWSVRPLKTGGEVAAPAEQIGKEAPQISKLTGEESPLQLACARLALLSIFACLFSRGQHPSYSDALLIISSASKTGFFARPIQIISNLPIPPPPSSTTLIPGLNAGRWGDDRRFVGLLHFVPFTFLYASLLYSNSPQPPCERDPFTTQSGEKRKK